MRPSPNHPAGRRRAPDYQRWSCLICAQDGLGGVLAWTTHYKTHHYLQGETTP